MSFDIRYVEGAEGDRFAATQARAIFALLHWLAHRHDSGPNVNTTKMTDERQAA